MKKVVVIETTQSDEKLRAAINKALIANSGTIETIQLYPFNNRFRADYLDIYNDVLFKIGSDYEHKNFEALKIVDMADSVAENFSNDEDMLEIKDQFIEDAIYKALLD